MKNKTVTTTTTTPTTTKPRVRKPRATIAPVTPAALATVPTVVGPRALTLADVTTVPDGYVTPAYVAAFVTAFRAVAAMPSKTRDERAIVVTAFAASMNESMPGTAAPIGRHTGRFCGMPVFESQNTLFVAAALANVALTCGHIMAAWRVELPNAKCDYIARDYAWTTLSEYVNGRHNGTTVPDGVNIVAAWAKRNRVPVTPAE